MNTNKTIEENFGLTPYQTVGPYYSIGLAPLYKNELFQEKDSALHITISGKILDGKGAAIPDAVIEIWQADENGIYPENDEGFARVAMNDEGAYTFKTILPGSVVNSNGYKQAPHINVGIFMRGSLKRLNTRIYFSEKTTENEQDPTLKFVPIHRKATLLAVIQNEKNYLLNFVIQGEKETVFFDY